MEIDFEHSPPDKWGSWNIKMNIQTGTKLEKYVYTGHHEYSIENVILGIERILEDFNSRDEMV